MTDENKNTQSTGNLSAHQDSGITPPFWISLLSIAVILFNLWFLISLFNKRDELVTGNGLPIYATPISLNYFIFLCFIFTMGVVVGITFWLGKSWGWWLFVLWCFYDLFASVKSLVLLFAENGLWFYIVGNASLLVIEICAMALIILYLFENSAFGYYNLDTNRKHHYAVYLATGAVIGVVLRSLLKA